MSALFLNTSALEKFKRSPEYPEIISSISIEEKTVSLDWINALKNIKISETLNLHSDSQSTSFVHAHHGELNVVYDLDDEEIEIDVHVFTEMKNSEVFDQMLAILSRTSMTEININYDSQGPCDIYLHRNKYAIFIYNNVIIEINTTDINIDIKYIANNICNSMTENLIDSKKINNINVILNSPVQNIKMNDQFTIFTKTFDDDIYDFQLLELNNKNFELISYINNEYNIKAIKAGEYKLNFGVMHKNTLLSQLSHAEVNVVE